MKRIGIYSGTFNPIHAGHISFALQAINQAKLDRVYFLPERYRSDKSDVEHFGHRVAMIRQAVKPHNRLGLIELTDITFSVDKTLPKLESKFSDDQLVFLLGSDQLKTINNWPNIDRLLKKAEIVVGIREQDQDLIKGLVKNLKPVTKKIHLIDSYAPRVSSSKIRDALRRHKDTEGILDSVRRYSNQNWLYISLI